MSTRSRRVALWSSAAFKKTQAAATEKIDADPFYKLVAQIREEGGINFEDMLASHMQ